MSDLLIQQSARHSVYIQRYAGHLSNLFDPYIERLIREFKLIMVDAPESTTSLRRINQLVNEWRRASIAIYGEYNDDILFNDLEQFATGESEWQLNSIKSAVKDPSIDFSLPAPAQVWSAVNASPLIFPDSNGVKLLDAFIKDWEAIQIKNVGDRIRTGFITGRTTQQIVQDIAGKNGYIDKTNRASIKTMVRTAANNLSTVARQKTYDDNSDIIIGYEIVATLDRKTSDICKYHDGMRVLNKGLTIDATGRKTKTTSKPKPAFHPNCRTTTAPILAPEFEDTEKGKRASAGVKGGAQVDADLTYFGWLKKQGQQGKAGRDFVQDILGKERGKLFLDGGLSAERFQRLTLDELFRPIPLDKLKNKQSLQLAFDAID